MVLWASKDERLNFQQEEEEFCRSDNHVEQGAMWDPLTWVLLLLVQVLELMRNQSYFRPFLLLMNPMEQ